MESVNQIKSLINLKDDEEKEFAGKAMKEVLEKNLYELCDSKKPLTGYLKLLANNPTIRCFIMRDID